MPYTKQTWQDQNIAYPLSAARMGNIEQGIADAQTTAEAALAAAQGNGGSIDHGHVLMPGDSIQAAVDAGHKLILLNPGEYPVSSTITLGSGARGTRIVGAGQTTRLVSTKTGVALSSLVQINGSGNDGIQLEALVLDCDAKADVGLLVQPTSAVGNYQGEPDAVFRFSNLWVYDANNVGVRALDATGGLGGTSYSRASHYDRIRVRRAGVRGFEFGAADSLIVDCEATTQSTDAQGAGLYMGGANNKIDGFKAWYCRNYGIWVRGTRNRFIGSETQDTRNHGWFLDWDKNTYVGCIADSAAYGDVGGTLNGADGWYVAGTNATLQACMGFDRKQGFPAQQRYGINAPSSMFDPDANGQVRISGFVGWDNATALIHRR